MFKVTKMNISPSLQNNLNLQIREHPRNTRGNGLYAVPFPRVENIRINYKYHFVTIWNNLPAAIKDISRLSVFLKKIDLSSNGELLIAINFYTVFTCDLAIFARKP